MKYSHGFNYVIERKDVTPAQIADDIKEWEPEQVESAFIALAFMYCKENWKEVKTKFEEGFKE